MTPEQIKAAMTNHYRNKKKELQKLEKKYTEVPLVATAFEIEYLKGYCVGISKALDYVELNFVELELFDKEN